MAAAHSGLTSRVLDVTQTRPSLPHTGREAGTPAGARSGRRRERRAAWTEQLAALSRAIRRHLLAHPAVVPFALQQPGLGPPGLRLGEAVYAVLRPAGFSDQTVVGTVYALLTYILGFVALEIPRAGTDPQTSDEFVRRLHAFFAALPAGEFPHTVALAPLLARISTEDQFEFGIATFLAGLEAQRPGSGAG